MELLAKRFVVDDICAYVGHQNVCECDLAKWGVVIDHEESVQRIL